MIIDKLRVFCNPHMYHRLDKDFPRYIILQNNYTIWLWKQNIKFWKNKNELIKNMYKELIFI